MKNIMVRLSGIPTGTILRPFFMDNRGPRRALRAKLF
jgi:hypothetical protein